MPISSVHGSFGEHLGRPKIAHGSHNDVRRLCWPNWGCESPLVETPKGSLCWENLCGWERLVGGTDWERTDWKEGNSAVNLKGIWPRRAPSALAVHAAGGLFFSFFFKFNRGSCLGCLNAIYGPEVSTQRKYACVFAGSDVLRKCKRITLTLSSVLTCILHGRRHRGQGATAPPLWREGGRSPSRRLHFDFKSRHPLLRLASFAYVVYPVIFTGCS